MIFPLIPIAQGLPKARADAFPVVPLEILGASTAPQQKSAKNPWAARGYRYPMRR